MLDDPLIELMEDVRGNRKVNVAEGESAAEGPLESTINKVLHHFRGIWLLPMSLTWRDRLHDWRSEIPLPSTLTASPSYTMSSFRWSLGELIGLEWFLDACCKWGIEMGFCSSATEE